MSAVSSHLTNSSTKGNRSSGVPLWPALLIVFAAGLAGLIPTFRTLGPKWLDSYGYSHGFLVALICVWLLWQLRDRIAATPPRRSLAAMVALAGVLFMWTLSLAAGVQIGVEALLPAALWLGAACLLGLGGAGKLLFPIGFVYFAIPLWDSINSILQNTTTAIVSRLLPIVGVPAFIEGNRVEIPEGVFQIAGGCSGLHFFVVALALASLYGYLYYERWRQRITLFATAAAMSLVTNWLRVTIIITAGHLTDMQSYLVKVDHYTFGWVLFGVMLFPFYWLARRLERPTGDAKADSDDQTAAQTGTLRVPASWLALTVAVMLAPALVWTRPAPNPAVPALVFPAVADWRGPETSETTWSPRFAKADVSQMAVYRRGDVAVDLYLNWYAAQAQGREVVGFGNHPEGDWRVRVHGVRSVELARGSEWPVREMIADSPQGERRLIWYWYQIGDQAEVSNIRAKLVGGLQALSGRHGAGLVALSTLCKEDCALARASLGDIMTVAAGPIRRELLVLANAGPSLEGVDENGR